MSERGRDTSDEKSDVRALRQIYQWARRASWREPGRKVQGRGLEFGNYRNYVPGDDLRHIDWVVYARLSKLVVKVTEDLPEPRIDLILDSSESMAAGHPPALGAAALLAAAFGAVFMARGSVVGARDGGDVSHEQEFRGQGRLLALLRALRAYQANGAETISAAAGRFLGRKHRSIIFFTDGMMPRELFLDSWRRLQKAGHALLVVLVEPPRECPEDWLDRGALWDFEVAESGQRETRYIDRELLKEMSEKRGSLLTELGEDLDRLHCPWTRIPSDLGVEVAVPRFFAPWTQGGPSLAGF